VIDALQVGNVPENKGVVHRNLPANAIVHGIDVRLVDGHALFGQRGSIVDGNLMELWVLRPELIQNKQQFLGTTKGKHRNQTPAALLDNFLHQRGEAILAILSLLVDVRAIGGLCDQDIRLHGRHLGGHQMPILLAGKVAGVQDLDASNLDHEHGSPQYMTGIICAKPNAHNVALLVEIDCLDLFHGGLQISLRVEHLLGGYIADLDVIGQHPAVNGFGGMGHEAAALEAGLHQEPRQGATMIQVEAAMDYD